MRLFALLSVAGLAACGIPEAPTVDSVRITPDTLVAGDQPSCEAFGFESLEGGSDQSFVTWFIDGMPAAGDWTLTDGIRGGNEITCEVRPFDGITQGPAVSTSVIVGNSPPSYVGAQIQPFVPVEGYPISCQAWGFYDVDMDMDVSGPATWTRDGVAVFGAGAMFPGPVEAGHTYACTIFPDDGEDEGEPVTASVTL
jgi:hypothetical protein